MSFFPPPPLGYSITFHAERNLLVAFHVVQPTLYLDEAVMQWRELDRHVSEVHPVQDSSPARG